MTETPLSEWKKWAGSFTMLPYAAAYAVGAATLPEWEPLWQEASGRQAFVLESGKGGRYTIFGHTPVSVIRGKGNKAFTENRDGQGGYLHRELEGEPLALIRSWMEPWHSPVITDLPKFSGGCVGFLGYDVVRSLERLPVSAADDLGIPDYVMLRFEQVWVLDQQERLLYCCVHTCNPEMCSEEEWLASRHRIAVEKAAEMKAEWDRMVAMAGSKEVAERSALRRHVVETDDLSIDLEQLPGLERAFGKEAFMGAVERIREYIAAGDVFQVNLSVRQSRNLQTSPEDIYEWLRALNPSPYMAFLKLDGLELVSASPELLVQIEGDTVRTRPIAGTRKRGATEEEDRRLRDELLHNEKERAEHIMLVDLERNDLGRISRYGTVQVTELMAIEYYSHVMHIVSEISGQLAEGKDAYDVIAASFPGGTITGAPKVRTMEIIEELEPVRRGPYTGSIGWLDYNGNMEFNIVIRTLLSAGGKAHVQAGAGIVIDSVPEREYKEALNKAKALWKAVEYSERYLADRQ